MKLLPLPNIFVLPNRSFLGKNIIEDKKFELFLFGEIIAGKILKKFRGEIRFGKGIFIFCCDIYLFETQTVETKPI